MMGDRIILFFENMKKEWKVAFISTFVMGLITHAFKFLNNLPNHDALFNSYADQNMIGLGRWFLSPACAISTYFDLPWIIGLFSIILISISAILIIEILDIHNYFVIILSSGLLVTFPSITETFYFEYTADGYMVAMLLATISVLITLIEKDAWWRVIIAIICVCLECAIYQSYVCFGLVLCTIYLACTLLEQKHEIRIIVKWIIRQAIIYVSGMAIYYVIWKVLLALSNREATPYEGVNTIGLSVGVILGAFERIVHSFKYYFFDRNISEYGFSFWSVLSILFALLFTFILVTAVVKSKVYNNKYYGIIFAICIIALPFEIFIWHFTTPDLFYHTRMMGSICLVYIFAIILCDRWVKANYKEILSLYMVIFILNNVLSANIFYYHMNLCYERSYAIANEISTRIHMLDDGSVKYISVVGTGKGFLSDPDHKGYLLGGTGPLRFVDHTIVNTSTNLALFLATYMDFSLSYYEKNDIEISIFTENGSTSPKSGAWEVRFPIAPNEVQMAIEDSAEVKDMNAWPAFDAVKKIDDVIVVKLSN